MWHGFRSARVWRTLAAGALPGLLSMGLHAQELPATANMSEDEAVKLALTHHPGQEAWRQRTIAATILMETTAVLAAPEIRLSTADDVGDKGVDGKRNKVSILWSPPQWGEAGLRSELLDRRRNEAVAAQALAAHQLAANVRRTHATLRVQQALLLEAERQVALQNQSLQIAREQTRAKRRTRLELLGLELRAAEATSARDRIRHEQDSLFARLRGLLGDAPAAATGLSVSAEALATAAPRGILADEPTDGQSIIQARPDIRKMTIHCTGVDTETRILEMENRPWFKDVGIVHTTQPDRIPAWGVQVGLNVPITGARNGAAAGMEAQRAACVSDTMALELAAQQELADARRNHAAALAQWSQQQAVVLPLHEQAVALGQQTRAAGRLDAGDLLGLQIRHSEARTIALKRLLELRLAEIGLLQAMGKALPD